MLPLHHDPGRSRRSLRFTRIAIPHRPFRGHRHGRAVYLRDAGAAPDVRAVAEDFSRGTSHLIHPVQCGCGIPGARGGSRVCRTARRSQNRLGWATISTFRPLTRTSIDRTRLPSVSRIARSIRLLAAASGSSLVWRSERELSRNGWRACSRRGCGGGGPKKRLNRPPPRRGAGLGLDGSSTSRSVGTGPGGRAAPGRGAGDRGSVRSLSGSSLRGSSVSGIVSGAEDSRRSSLGGIAGGLEGVRTDGGPELEDTGAWRNGEADEVPLGGGDVVRGGSDGRERAGGAVTPGMASIGRLGARGAAGWPAFGWDRAAGGWAARGGGC